MLRNRCPDPGCSTYKFPTKNGSPLVLPTRAPRGAFGTNSFGMTSRKSCASGMNPSPSQKCDSTPSLLHFPESYLIWTLLLVTSSPVSTHISRAEISSTVPRLDSGRRQAGVEAMAIRIEATINDSASCFLKDVIRSLPLCADYTALIVSKRQGQ